MHAVAQQMHRTHIPPPIKALETSSQLGLQVHGALGDEDSDGGYAQHPRRDHAEKDLPHGPPPPGHRFLRALQGGVADWNGDDGSEYAR